MATQRVGNQSSDVTASSVSSVKVYGAKRESVHPCVVQMVQFVVCAYLGHQLCC